MRIFKPLNTWYCGELNVEEINSNKCFVLTQRKTLISEDFYTIQRTIGDPVDYGNFEYIYIISWLENGGANGTVSCSKIIDHETMIDIIKNNTDDLLQGSLDLKKYFEEQKVTKETNVKSWYIKEFPTDNLGKELTRNSFEEIYDGMNKGIDFYNLIGVGDSVVRERVFDQLSKIYNCSYDDIYNLWLKGDD